MEKHEKPLKYGFFWQLLAAAFFSRFSPSRYSNAPHGRNQPIFKRNHPPR
jgi:hypothetical protein